ncbi:inovirus Gp2 family protein [Vibrio rumoiensis]|uniref:inovirus Gp2 family protein n=1 Tax=Vibrio rumoiensis TaxID=76258 RepID=UPI003AA8B7B8
MMNSCLSTIEHDGWSILTSYTLNDTYLDRIRLVMNKAMNNHARTFVLRFDLHALSLVKSDTRVISRFFESLKAKIKAYEKRKVKFGVRVHKTKLEYIWCKEEGKSNNPHYHVAIFLNANSFNRIGDYRVLRDNLAGLIYSAWSSAIRVSTNDIISLVHFPKSKPFYQLNVKDEHYTFIYNVVFRRLSYLAKYETKKYGSGKHNFGYSR